MSAYDPHDLVARFIAEARERLAAGNASGEAQLIAPVDGLLSSFGRAIGRTITPVHQQQAQDGICARPDIAVRLDGLLVGYVEVKAPGKGADPDRFAMAHDKEQWARLKALPNLIYTDGGEWALYRAGSRACCASLPDLCTLRGARVSAGQVDSLAKLVREFLSWAPIVPGSAEQLAETLAPLCRIVRDDVLAAVRRPDSALTQLAKDWRKVLFPDADDAQFADAYAQTLTYALLLARLDRVTRDQGNLNASRAAEALVAGHGLLAQALKVLADQRALDEIGTGVALLERAISAVDPARVAGGPDEDKWLYFYEHFLGAYDPVLRNDRGVYYTPVEVVSCQVSLVSQLLTKKFSRVYSFADDGVVLLDPAAGTGTYLLAAIDRALSIVRERAGPGAVGGRATMLARNIHAFEILVGPYAVAHLRLTQRLNDACASLPDGGVNVYLCDTLESPHAAPPGWLPLALRRLGEEHERARRVKAETRVLVCVGNPPYDRHRAEPTAADGRRGGWVRHGDGADKGIFIDFIEPARRAGAGVHLKNAYNLYAYFWRWALWKVFESTNGPGIVSFITASSYLSGPAFIGMREVMRRTFDELWIIDLEGDAHGARKTENVFNIQTPVAIAVGVRYGPPRPEVPATARYTRLTGSRKEKLLVLARIEQFDDVTWSSCPDGWHAPFLPEGRNQDYPSFPALTDLFPWQQSGVQMKRNWPRATTRGILYRRWEMLLAATSGERRALFRETGYRAVDRSGRDLIDVSRRLPPIRSLKEGSAPVDPTRYGFRSLDRQWLLPDARLGDRMRPPLWLAYGSQQVFLTSLLSKALGAGPAATVTALIPDLDHFSGRGGKDIIPLWRNREATEPNVTRGLLKHLSTAYGFTVTPEGLLCYCYSLLACCGYARGYMEELRIPPLRVPLTADGNVFAEASAEGRRLVWLHTYGERCVPKGWVAGRIPQGKARALSPIPGKPAGYPEESWHDENTETLHVGAGTFCPVPREAWDFEISGLFPLHGWLDHRMKHPAGKRSSPLDEVTPQSWPPEFTDELLELLWILEATVEAQPRLDSLLHKITTGPFLTAETLPSPAKEERRPPTADRAREKTRQQEWRLP